MRFHFRRWWPGPGLSICLNVLDSFAVNPISDRVRGVFSDAIKVSEAVPKLCDSASRFRAFQPLLPPGGTFTPLCGESAKYANTLM